MKTITNDYKENVKIHGRQLDSKITYTIDNEEIELGNEDLNSVTPHYEGNILKSVMKQLDIDSNVEIPKNTILNYEFGVLVNNEYEYINFGNYIVYDVEKQEDTDSYKITCYDKMLYAMKDYENMNITYPITIRNYINAICNYLGLTFKNINDTFANYNKQINAELYLDASGNSLGYTFRDVLDELAQVTASTICINENDDNLEIRYINDTDEIIDEESLKDINVSFSESIDPINTIVLSRSGGSDKISLSQPIDLPNADKNSLVITDNQIMNFNDRGDYLPDILNKLYGLQYYLNDFSSTGITYLELCDKYNIQIGENIYSCIMFNDEINITQGLMENIHTDMMEEEETDYTKTDKTDRRINQTYSIVDKQNQIIESVVSNVSQQDAKISQITQTVDEINAKISDVIDITVSGESNFATFTLENVNTSEPIQIKIKPITDNISYLYPYSGLYPSSNLYSKNRKIRFHNIGDNTNIDYEIPNDLLYYNNEIYDEFYLDYDSHTCQVTKRCKYNADGTISVLAQEQIINYPYPTIELQDGDYVLSLLGYEYGYLFVRLMAKNVYTTQFYTKVETDSRINQKADEIDIGVNQKLSDYSTTTEMNAAINVKANKINQTVSQKVGKNEIVSSINQTPERIKINASKINLTGYVTFSELEVAGMTTINGANITTGSIDANLIKSGQLQVYGYSENEPFMIIGRDDIDYPQGPYGCYFWDYGMSAFNYGIMGTRTIPTISTNTESGYAQLHGNDIECTGFVTSARGVCQGSLEKIKKDFEKFDNALDIIKDIDIYKYHYKKEKNIDKKHIGLVIGDTYKYRKEVTNNNNDSVDLYSFISVCCKAIQEQQNIIENLTKRIQKLEKESDK